MNKIGIRILLCGAGMLLVALLSGCSAGPNLTFSSARPIDRSERIDCPSDSSTPCTATVGTAFTGILVSGDMGDWIEVTLAELTIYKIELTVGSPTMMFQDADGEAVIVDDDNQFATQAGGTYIVMLSGLIGEYSLLISRIGAVPDPVRVRLTEENITITIDESELTPTQTTVWWAVYADNTISVPTVAEVKAGTNAVGGAFNGAAGTLRGEAANSEYTVTGTISPAIEAGKGYDVYIVVGDGTTDSRLDKEDAMVPASLPTKPTVPPSVTATLSAATGNNLDITGLGSPAGTGTIYWAVYADMTTPAPSATAIQAGSGAINNAASGSIAFANAGSGITTGVTGITAGTKYEVYVVYTAQNSAGTTDSDVTLVGDDALEASAVDITAPNIRSETSAGYSDDDDMTPDEQKLTITLKGVNEAGRAYWVIVAQGVTLLVNDVRSAGGGAGDIDYNDDNRAAGNATITTRGSNN